MSNPLSYTGVNQTDAAHFTIQPLNDTNMEPLAMLWLLAVTNKSLLYNTATADLAQDLHLDPKVVDYAKRHVAATDDLLATVNVTFRTLAGGIGSYTANPFCPGTLGAVKNIFAAVAALQF